AALAFRRAADAEASGWIAAFAIAPVVQIATIGLLSAMPSRAVVGDAAVVNRRGPLDWAAAAQGLFLGVAVTLFAVATGALLFGSYGFGIFVASPFTIGATTGYFANRRADLSPLGTAELVAGAIFFGWDRSADRGPGRTHLHLPGRTHLHLNGRPAGNGR